MANENACGTDNVVPRLAKNLGDENYVCITERLHGMAEI